jgi:hypothetical protein
MLLAITLGCVTISLSTNKMADRYYQELRDYAVNNRLREEVKNFEAVYWTYHSQAEYIHKRTTEASTVMVGLCACWAGACLFYLILLIRDGQADAGDDKATLIGGPPNDL